MSKTLQIAARVPYVPHLKIEEKKIWVGLKLI